MAFIGDYFPVWQDLSAEERQTIESAAVYRHAAKGTLLHSGGDDCVGLLVIAKGWLRAFIVSGEGREITLYRLFSRDICLFSGACMLKDIDFDISIEAGEDADFWVIPPGTYKELMDRSPVLSRYTNSLMAARFSEVMWLMDQVLFKRFDARLADFLLEEAGVEESDTLHLTHDQIARHLGTAREVVTRMLKNFAQEGLVTLARGTVTLTDRKGLETLGGA